MPVDLLIGLVTHARSRYLDSQGPQGLAARLANELARHGRSTLVEVRDEDAYHPELLHIDASAVRRSIDAELRTELAWREFLDSPGKPGIASAWFLTRRAYRYLRYAPPWRRSMAAEDAGARMLRRLINIELAHISLMRSALAAGSEWALILEDDAWAEDAAAVAGIIAELTSLGSTNPHPSYVNLSASFAHDQLGAEHLFSPRRTSLAAQPDTGVLVADRPVTNTVCAVLYRTSFLQQLLAVFEEIPLSPVLPIDWKLNKALMILADRHLVGPGDCWFVEPGPIVQRSMANPQTSSGHRP